MWQCLWWHHIIWNLQISQKHKHLDISRTKHFSSNKKIQKLHLKGYFIAKNSFVAEVTFKVVESIGSTQKQYKRLLDRVTKAPEAVFEFPKLKSLLPKLRAQISLTIHCPTQQHINIKILFYFTSHKQRKN